MVSTMQRCGTHKMSKYTTFIGCFMIIMCQSLHWYWGNLSIYIASYFRVIHGIKLRALSAWTLSVYLLAWNSLTLLAHFLSVKFGKRWIMLCGILATEIGLLLGWLGLLYPEIPLEIGFGFMLGLASGFTNAVAIDIVLGWVEENPCFVTSCILAAMSAGGLIITQAISWYINPSNETPITVGQWMPFFKDHYINENVPRFLVVLTISTSIISLVGFCMIRIRPRRQHTETENEGTHLKSTESKSVSYDSKDNNIETHIEKSAQYTAKGMLRTKAFYVLAFCILTCDFSLIISTTYYKEFGQRTIKDDHFLTLVGTTPPILNVISIIFSGVLIDRFGAQRPLIILYTILTITSAFFYVAPSGGKLPFFLVSQIFITLPNTLYNDSVLALINVFGNYQIVVKLSMLYSVSIISTLSLPIVAESLMLSNGWFPLFILVAVSNFVAVILIAIGLPYH